MSNLKWDVPDVQYSHKRQTKQRRRPIWVKGSNVWSVRSEIVRSIGIQTFDLRSGFTGCDKSKYQNWSNVSQSVYLISTRRTTFHTQPHKTDARVFKRTKMDSYMNPFRYACIRLVVGQKLFSPTNAHGQYHTHTHMYTTTHTRAQTHAYALRYWHTCGGADIIGVMAIGLADIVPFHFSFSQVQVLVYLRFKFLTEISYNTMPVQERWRAHGRRRRTRERDTIGHWRVWSHWRIWSHWRVWSHGRCKLPACVCVGKVSRVRVCVSVRMIGYSLQVCVNVMARANKPERERMQWCGVPERLAANTDRRIQILHDHRHLGKEESARQKVSGAWCNCYQWAHITGRVRELVRARSSGGNEHDQGVQDGMYRVRGANIRWHLPNLSSISVRPRERECSRWTHCVSFLLLVVCSSPSTFAGVSPRSVQICKVTLFFFLITKSWNCFFLIWECLLRSN